MVSTFLEECKALGKRYANDLNKLAGELDAKTQALVEKHKPDELEIKQGSSLLLMEVENIEKEFGGSS